MSTQIPLPQLTHDDVIAIERELAKRSLSDFIAMGWHVIERGRPYVHGWHIDAMSEHLEAVTAGQINRLLINVPPGMMKSLEVGVFWPMWEWGPKGMPHYRYLGASHAERLAIRDNLRCKRLFTSEWYQQRWPCEVARDQNAKTRFENVETGFREAMAIESVTGSRGDRVLIDDPHSIEGALSDNKRETAVRVFEETIPTRVNDPELSAIVVIMQRIHERDVSAIAIEHGYEHLMLPMEFEPERKCYTSIGFEDPRTEPGELLFPQRFPKEVVERDKRTMGSMAVAGQFQQRPAPRGGGMFKTDMIEVGEAPKIVRAVRYWDKAGTQGGGAYTAGVLMGVDKYGHYWVLDVVRGQWSSGARERIIRQTAEMDGESVPVWVEREPGSGGKESAEFSIKNLAGFVVRADLVTGSKEDRAEPLAVQVEGGNVSIQRAAWNKDFLDEMATFPVGQYKDQVDAAAGAFNKLVGKTKRAGVW